MLPSPPWGAGKLPAAPGAGMLPSPRSGSQAPVPGTGGWTASHPSSCSGGSRPWQAHPSKPETMHGLGCFATQAVAGRSKANFPCASVGHSTGPCPHCPQARLPGGLEEHDATHAGHSTVSPPPNIHERVLRKDGILIRPPLFSLSSILLKAQLEGIQTLACRGVCTCSHRPGLKSAAAALRSLLLLYRCIAEELREAVGSAERVCVQWPSRSRLCRRAGGGARSGPFHWRARHEAAFLGGMWPHSSALDLLKLLQHAGTRI